MSSALLTMAPTSREKRYFPRINYRTYATLATAGAQFDVHILDLSFKGALAALLHPHPLQDGEAVTLTIELRPPDHPAPGKVSDTIKMRGHLAHQKGHYLGIECRASGIDNQTRLRELLEERRDQPPGDKTPFNPKQPH